MRLRSPAPCMPGLVVQSLWSTDHITHQRHKGACAVRQPHAGRPRSWSFLATPESRKNYSLIITIGEPGGFLSLPNPQNSLECTRLYTYCKSPQATKLFSRNSIKIFPILQFVNRRKLFWQMICKLNFIPKLQTFSNFNYLNIEHHCITTFQEYTCPKVLLNINIKYNLC